VKISRRDFLKYCGVSAAVLGISTTELGQLEEALANPNAPTVIWLQGSGCTGCSVSFLNRISTSAPKSAADILVNFINLQFHAQLMSVAGESAVSIVEDVYNNDNYILVVEGGVPTAFGGATCWAWSYNGVDVTFQSAVKDLAARALKVVCIGTCASWGGIAAAAPNPTGVKGVKAATGKTTINVAGCPPHPDWITWAIVQLLINNTVTLDSYGRPKALYGKTVHDLCPRKETDETNKFGVDKRCLKELGCRGPETRANCPTQLWNNRSNWCVDANAPCLGCTEPTFPGTKPFYTHGDSGGDSVSSRSGSSENSYQSDDFDGSDD
jgi:hydrogenase small subunit